MSKEEQPKAIVGCRFTEFWGKNVNLGVIDEIAAPDMLLKYSLNEPRRGRDDIKAFMTDFRAAFPDLNFWGAADLIAEGGYVVGQWEGGGTHAGPAFNDFLIGGLPAATGRKMRFTGTTVLKVINGKIVEEIGLDDGVTALTRPWFDQGRLIAAVHQSPPWLRGAAAIGFESKDRSVIADTLRHHRRCKKMPAILTKKQNFAPTFVTDDPRWARIVARDKSADGQLWYSVSTTGVYCRPSCPSRIPNPNNIQIHDTLDSAQATGFRPCKRCNPNGASIDAGNAALVAKACRVIEDSEEEPSLKELADAMGRSSSYFHRVFKATTGLTPKDYASAHRAKKVRQGLASGNTVTHAIYDAGFNSSGRFYEKSTDMLGMTPSQYRAGGTNEEIRFAVGQTSLGAILVASSKKGVAAILLGDDPDELVRNLQDRFPKARLIGADCDYEALVARVVGFVEMQEVGLSLPLDVRGTAFQQRVWHALQEIPAGETVSYAEVARRIGSPKAVRAVAVACAANNFAVVIPCHRVVRTDGALSGYAWGVERKRILLDREAQHGEKFFINSKAKTGV